MHNLSNKAKFLCFEVIALLIGEILFVMFIVMPQFSGGYNASLLDKINRLQEIEEPKIVLIGDSNVAFGIKSEMLEKAFGRPVVNMGLHGSLGNPFHEEMAKININEGDWIILCHSTYNDDDTIVDPTVAWVTIENHMGLWRLVRMKDIGDMYKAFPNYLKIAISYWSSGSGNKVNSGNCYSRDAFNDYGDVATYRPYSEYSFSSATCPLINDTCTNRINKLNSYIISRGGTLLIAGIPIGDGEYLSDSIKSSVQCFGKTLAQKVDCPVISNYADYLLDYKFFYNSNLHLTDEGATIRTAQLIEDMQKYFNKNCGYDLDVTLKDLQFFPHQGFYLQENDEELVYTLYSGEKNQFSVYNFEDEERIATMKMITYTSSEDVEIEILAENFCFCQELEIGYMEIEIPICAQKGDNPFDISFTSDSADGCEDSVLIVESVCFVEE